MQRVDSLEKTLMLGGIGAGGEGDDRGWDGWMASPTRWTCVWVDSRSWWWTGRPGVLRFMGSQRVGHDWETELNWAEWFSGLPYFLQVLQARVQQYVIHELSDVQVGFRKGRETRDQIANIRWIIKNHKSSKETSPFALLTMQERLAVRITTNCGQFLKRQAYQTTWIASWEICMQVKKQQCRVHHEKRWAGWSTSWNQDCQEKYQ